MQAEKFIDVNEVLSRKAPKWKKRIPKFLINYVIRIIHQDELNDILFRFRELDGVAFMQALIREFDLKLEIFGEENLPKKKRCIFVANHPLGGLDGICLSAMLGEKYDSKIYYLVNDLLMFIPNLKSIFVPINKHGAQGKLGASKMKEAFLSDHQILTFPAGLCSRKKGVEICDLDWKKSFIQKSVEYQRDIVPIYFEGRNSNFFYRLANIRKRLGFKMNIEMLYLPDEMFKNKHSTFRIYIGKPLPWQTFDGSKKTVDWADWVKKRVYSLRVK